MQQSLMWRYPALKASPWDQTSATERLEVIMGIRDSLIISGEMMQGCMAIVKGLAADSPDRAATIVELVPQAYNLYTRGFYIANCLNTFVNDSRRVPLPSTSSSAKHSTPSWGQFSRYCCSTTLPPGTLHRCLTMLTSMHRYQYLKWRSSGLNWPCWTHVQAARSEHKSAPRVGQAVSAILDHQLRLQTRAVEDECSILPCLRGDDACACRGGRRGHQGYRAAICGNIDQLRLEDQKPQHAQRLETKRGAQLKRDAALSKIPRGTTVVRDHKPRDAPLTYIWGRIEGYLKAYWHTRCPVIPSDFGANYKSEVVRYHSESTAGGWSSGKLVTYMPRRSIYTRLNCCLTESTPVARGTVVLQLANWVVYCWRWRVATSLQLAATNNSARNILRVVLKNVDGKLAVATSEVEPVEQDGSDNDAA
ncbi:hypothetical protein JKP88DRAFT_249347 [Tribonema minus]|uniref:Uncharacterized protein n=1 Tax=Tribonema minus TaxID=303371 RepID=A0A836C9D9_9STRA|nr:hypothetical protein JKP88DRAFT_249347 [Tribonema minus]